MGGWVKQIRSLGLRVDGGGPLKWTDFVQSFVRIEGLVGTENLLKIWTIPRGLCYICKV